MKDLTGHRETDWLGNEYGVGDTVLYPRMWGRSVEMVKGEVVSFYENRGHQPVTPVKVRIAPLEGSRFRVSRDEGFTVLITIIENITKIGS